MPFCIPWPEYHKLHNSHPHCKTLLLLCFGFFTVYSCCITVKRVFQEKSPDTLKGVGTVVAVAAFDAGVGAVAVFDSVGLGVVGDHVTVQQD